MDDRRNDGGPAFPIPPIVIGEQMFDDRAADGMSLRDWIAGTTAAGLVAAHPFMHSNNEFRTGRIKSVAGLAYQIADAMLEARK